MKKTEKRLGSRRHIDAFTVVNTILLLLIAFIMLYPFWYVLIGSFMRTDESITNIFHFIVKRPTMEAYEALFKSVKVERHFMASAYSSVVGMIVSLFFTSLAAYALSRPHLPGKGLVMRLVLGAMLFNGGMIPMYMVVRGLGMINRWESLYVPGLINLFYMIIMRTYFKGIPEEMLESARMDGAGEWKIFFRFIIPSAMPVIACIALFYMVDRWNDLMSGIIYINNVNDQPLQAMLYRIINGQTSTVNPTVGTSMKVTSETMGYAATIVTVLPIMLVYPFLQKYFIHGMMVGSVKD